LILASNFGSNQRSSVSRARPSIARGSGGALDQGQATGQGCPHLPGRPHPQGRPDQVVRPCLAHVTRWFQFLPKFVPAYDIHNTTHGTLLVLPMCMKLAIYSSETRGFDGRIFVLRTVNKLPQAKCLLVLEQSLDSASTNPELHDVIARQVLAHKLHALLSILKRLVREKLSLTLPVGLVAFHLALEVE
jgi:hypothetical protein